MRDLARSAALLVPLYFAGCAKERTGTRDTVRIAVPYEVQTLDPHAESKLWSLSLHSNVYEALVTADAEMRIEPCLATRWESPDPLHWVFQLRPGVTFHSGRPLRAADVVYSFNRLLGDSQLGMRNAVLDVSEVKATGPLSVEVRTRRSSRIFLSKLTAVLIVPEGSTSKSIEAAPDGTGPYAVAAWTPGKSLELRRHDGHWHRPRAAIGRVEFLLSRSPDEALRGLLAGEHQFMQGDSKRMAVATESGRHRLLRQSNLYVKYLGYDLAREATPSCSVRPNPFQDRRVRRAMHMAIDRHRLVAELSTYAVPALEPVPRFVFGFNPRIREPSYDKDQARALLSEAGFGDGFEVTLHTRRIFAEAAELVREELREVGIRVMLEPLPDAEFFARLARREATLWLSRFGCGSGDASDFLDDVVHSTDPQARLGTKNYGGYTNAVIDRAIERSAATDVVDKRRDTLQEVMAAVMEDLVWIPLYNDQDVYAIDSSLAWEPRADSFIHASDIAWR